MIPANRLVDMATTSELFHLKLVGAEKEAELFNVHLSFTATARAVIRSAYTIWLFTYSDIKTVILPSLLFSIFTALAAPVFDLSNTTPTWSTLLQRIPAIIFWLWINLLPMTIDNQRQPDSVAEDSLNKSWRPLPSQRLTPTQATYLVLTLYPLTFLASIHQGATAPTIALAAFGYWYNDLHGANHSCVMRNLLNACGLVCFAAGALVIALDINSHTSFQSPLNNQLTKWLVLIGAIVFTTIHTQDMHDQAGDRTRGRKTMPLVLGDAAARWSIAVAMTFWSLFGPWYWRMSAWAPATWLGLVVAGRTLSFRSVRADRTTYLLWNLWIGAVYGLPVLAMGRT